MPSHFVDVHAHLDMCSDTEEVVARAKKEDVWIIAAGVDHKSNAAILNLSRGHHHVGVCLGIYPVEAEKLTDKDLEKEFAFMKEHKEAIAGIGEVGLDLHEGEDLERQKIVLRKLVNVAKDLDKPLVVHSRKAEEETIAFLEGFKYKKIVMHCFSGNMKLVERILENGWFLSIPASVAYSEHFQTIVRRASLNQLLCETDSPFLHPEKKMNNEPAQVIQGYKKIAEIKNLELEDVKDAIWKNVVKLFGEM